MQKLPVRLLEPGMKLAKPVLDDKGNTLLGADTELVDKTIARLENMNIRNVMVKGCPVNLADFLPKPLEVRLAEMEQSFEPVRGDELMERFRVIVKAFCIKKDEEMRGEPDEPEPEPPAEEGAAPG